jgi:hypothetical protein
VGCYLAEEEIEYQQSWWYTIAHWFSRNFWLDLGADLGLALFAIATWGALPFSSPNPHMRAIRHRGK